MIITWHAGVTRIKKVVKRDGPSLIYGCQIGDGPFEPFIKLTFDDPKDQAMVERELQKQ